MPAARSLAASAARCSAASASAASSSSSPRRATLPSHPITTRTTSHSHRRTFIMSPLSLAADQGRIPLHPQSQAAPNPSSPASQPPPPAPPLSKRILAGVSRARSAAHTKSHSGAFVEEDSRVRQLQAPRGKQKGVRGVGSETTVMAPTAIIGAPLLEPRRAMAFATADRFDLDRLTPLLESAGYTILDHLADDVVHVVFPAVNSPGTATEASTVADTHDTETRSAEIDHSTHPHTLPPDTPSVPLVRPSTTSPHYSLSHPIPTPAAPTAISPPSPTDLDTFDPDLPPLPEAFIFSAGTFVTWGADERENSRLMDTLRGAEVDPYSAVETEWFDYVVDLNEPGGMSGDTILIGADLPPSQSALAFSSGLSRSVKLAALEALLDRHLAENRSVPRFLAKGRRLPMGQKEVLSKLGELLVFRGSVNLHSELLDAPDFCWSNPRMENYFESTSRNLDVRPRIAVFNKKLDYANELAATLKDHLSERHSNNLEWIIIVLIAVEVVSEAVHYAERLGYVDLERFRKGAKEPVIGWRWDKVVAVEKTGTDAAGAVN
ncbi:hypothetical protein HDU93_008106 [Gonapodya sp. JEL0774]|nr:hypothetical protein HDU93_008106 [Gonapodya sp. JEL0774]